MLLEGQSGRTLCCSSSMIPMPLFPNSCFSFLFAFLGLYTDLVVDDEELGKKIYSLINSDDEFICILMTSTLLHCCSISYDSGVILLVDSSVQCSSCL
jgi:hypothetical protein